MVAAAAPGYEKFLAESSLPTDVTVRILVSFAAERQPGRLIAQWDLPVLSAAHPHARASQVPAWERPGPVVAVQQVGLDRLVPVAKQKQLHLQ